MNTVMKEETDPRVAAYFRCLASAIEKEEKQRFMTETKQLTKAQRKAAVVASLYAIGESRFAMDFAAAESKEAYEAIESCMRQQLKRRGLSEAQWSSVVASAIVEAQLLPS